MEEVEGDSLAILRASTMIKIRVGSGRWRLSISPQNLSALVTMRTRLRGGACWRWWREAEHFCRSGERNS